MDENYSEIYQKVEDYFSDYGFDRALLDRYVAKIVRWSKQYKYNNSYDYQINRIAEIFHECEDYFRKQGYNDDRSVEAAKHLAPYYRSTGFVELLNMIKNMGLMEYAIDSQFNICRTSNEILHARYKYLLSIGFGGHMYNAITEGESTFKTRFHVSTASFKTEYPYTDEVKKIHSYLANKSDDYIQQTFGLTRKQLATIYPDNKRMLASLKRLHSYSDTKVKHMFGVDRETILSKPGLDYETLVALNSIQLSTNERVQELLGLKKEVILTNPQDWKENAKKLIKISEDN